MADLRFPIGDFSLEGEITETRRQGFIDEIANAPKQLREAVAGLNIEQIDTPYRPEGWTIRQVVHHMPDSHMNSYIRMRLALTEDKPTIRPYYEDRWGELVDARTVPVDVSLDLLESLHIRWVLFLQTLSAADCARTFFHPEADQHISIDTNIAIYAWHGKHHIAHITSLRERLGW